MQTLARLALTVAGRRVVQPFHARTLRVSPSYRAEPVPDPPAAPALAPVTAAPKKTKTKTSSPSPKPRTKKPAAPRKKLKLDSKGPRKPKTKASSPQARDGSGFKTDDWGKDELAPPTPTKRRVASKLRPKRETVPASTHPSSSRHAVPPHVIPYVRRTQGFIPQDPEPCTNVLRDVKSPSQHKPIAQLAHGLDRVLFNPGVYWLRDPRSRIYNFTPWLESIPAVTEFAFERVTGFVKSSMDDDLWKIAKKHKRPFAGSTSSMTGLLSHCYFLISGDKEVDTSSLSRAFHHQPKNFTPGQRMPTSVVLNYREGVWLIDSDKTQELAEKNVLTWMGTMLEKFLTVPETEFKKLLRSAPTVEEEKSDTRREAYRYAMSDRFVMRSQLDCVDHRLPGTGVFDVKTRAAVPIRLDILNYEENSGYLIKTLTGPLESFEKEYYDLIRSAFLKYSFQARIGNMDGVLVAYHNTARLFGFQYVPLEEMEEKIYGSANGTTVFNKCVSLLERVLSDVVSVYGERSVRCTFETRELSQELNVWIQPVEWDDHVEGKPRPITELDVEATSFIESEQVNGARAVSDGRAWTLQWTVSESALEAVEIERRLQGARERQFRALNFPAGVKSVEEMEKMWEKIDFGGKQDPGEVMAAMRGLQERGACEEEGPVLAEVGEDENESEIKEERPTTLASSLSFREPSRTIIELRRLAVQGREETMREEAEGREKVVWGTVDARCDVGADGGAGTLPGVAEVRGEVDSGGVVVGGCMGGDEVDSLVGRGV